MKRGFGLIEVLIAAVVLGFLVVGLNILQKGNREAVLRIRARDAAQEVAQDFLDSLSKTGLSAIANGAIINTENPALPVERTVEWRSEVAGTSKVVYTITGNVSENIDDSNSSSSLTLNSNESSQLTFAELKADTTHVTAKKVDLTVSWQFKKSTQSINVARVIK